MRLNLNKSQVPASLTPWKYLLNSTSLPNVLLNFATQFFHILLTFSIVLTHLFTFNKKKAQWTVTAPILVTENRSITEPLTSPNLEAILYKMASRFGDVRGSVMLCSLWQWLYQLNNLLCYCTITAKKRWLFNVAKVISVAAEWHHVTPHTELSYTLETEAMWAKCRLSPIICE